MACSDCFPGSSTVVKAGTGGVYISGSGTPSDPFVVSVGLTPDGDWGSAEEIDAAPDLNLASLTRPAVVEVVLSGSGEVFYPGGWGSNHSGTIRLILEQDGTGGRTLDFGAALMPSGAITLSTAGGAVDIVDLTWTGIRWTANLVASNLS
jgi:hypothetical protein